MNTRKVMIIDASCWSCEKEIQIALIGDLVGNLEGGPEVFTLEEEGLVKQHDVLLKRVQSITANENYLANVCHHCDSFVGKRFLFAHYYTPALYGDYKYKLV